MQRDGYSDNTSGSRNENIVRLFALGGGHILHPTPPPLLAQINIKSLPKLCMKSRDDQHKLKQNLPTVQRGHPPLPPCSLYSLRLTLNKNSLPWEGLGGGTPHNLVLARSARSD